MTFRPFQAKLVHFEIVFGEILRKFQYLVGVPYLGTLGSNGLNNFGRSVILRLGLLGNGFDVLEHCRGALYIKISLPNLVGVKKS